MTAGRTNHTQFASAPRDEVQQPQYGSIYNQWFYKAPDGSVVPVGQPSLSQSSLSNPEDIIEDLRLSLERERSYKSAQKDRSDAWEKVAGLLYEVVPNIEGGTGLQNALARVSHLNNERFRLNAEIVELNLQLTALKTQDGARRRRLVNLRNACRRLEEHHDNGRCTMDDEPLQDAIEITDEAVFIGQVADLLLNQEKQL